MEDFGLGHHTGYLLRLAHDHAHHAAERAFPAGPHPREYAVLTALATYGPVSQQRLADGMVVNRTSMVAIADELERRGYVERRRDADDRRSYALHLTDAGRAALERLHTEIAVADRAMTGTLRDDERARMNELLLAFVGSEAGHAIPPQLTDRSGFLVARAHVLARDEANELLRPLGITVRHFGLLTLLDRRGPSSQQAIAGAMLISATMVTQLVDQVEAAGLAERRPNPSDRRSYRVTLTAAGRRTLRAAGAVMDGLDARFAAALGANGDRELQDLLRKLVGA